MIPLFKVAMSPKAADAVAKVLDSGYTGQGPLVDQFEDRLQTLYDSKTRPVTVNSCTSAIDLALHLCNIMRGDLILASPMSCVATYVNAYHRGINIVWADVDPLTGLIDPKDVKKLVKQYRVPRIKAIIAIDWAGAPCDYNALRRVAPGIPIIEDAAHCFRTLYDDRPIARSGGDYICYSFQSIKHLSICDGGALICPPDQEQRARLLRWYGFDRTAGESFRCSQNLTKETIGFKYHMTDVAAAIGLANVDLALQNIDIHKSNAFHYSISIDHPGIITPEYNHSHSWWLYTLIIKGGRRDEFIKYLEKYGIASSQVHRRADLHAAFENFATALPGVSNFDNSQCAIPVGFWVSNADREYITSIINAFPR